MDAFINKEVLSKEGGYIWEEPCQVLTEYTDMDEVVYQNINENLVDTYGQFVGTEVCLPDERGRKMMDRVTKRMKKNEGNPRESELPTLFTDH